MKLRRRFSSAFRPLLAYRARTLLALSGLAVGVAAVIVARAVGEGAQQEMNRAVERLGTCLLVVKPLQVKRPVFRPRISGTATTLSPADFEAIKELPYVTGAAPVIERRARLKLGGMAMKVALRGTTPDFLAVRRFALAEGRLFNAVEMERTERVAVIGSRVNRELGRGESVLGRTVRVGGVLFEVIGVLQEKGTTPDGSNEDDQVLIPLQTAFRRVFNEHWLSTVYANASEPGRLDQVGAAMRTLLRQRHRIGVEDDDFAVQNTSKVRAFQQEMNASLSRYATWLAGIALLIGGFGIMALMYISLRERTGEIGLRIAVGAEQRDILFQFLIEAALMAFAGWLSGLVLAALCAAIVTASALFPMAVPLPAVLLSLAMTVVIGIGFGALPAKAAARIPPIQALTKS